MILSDLLQANVLADPRALAKPSIALISARTHWSNIQPHQPVGGVPNNNPNDASYNWTYVDQIFAQAATFNKGVWLRVVVQEFDAPGWLRAIVAQYLDVTGTTLNIWWDTTYIAYMTAMIQAVATRYGPNPRFQVFACNFAATGAGDWAIPHTGQGTDPDVAGAANWGLTAGWVCPAYNGTVTAFPQPNSTVYPGWVVFVQNFGYFIVQSVFGPTNNPTSVVLLNPGYAGNASSGNTGAGKIMQVSDQQQLTSPKYGYTTAQLVNALNQIITVATAALPSTVIYSHEVGRDGQLDPFPNSGTTYGYNAATQMAQFGYANVTPGHWAIAKNGFQSQTPAPAQALADQDSDNFYLLAQTVFGSTNTSGTTGSIPLGGLLNGQFSWPCFDTTGTYSPATTGGQKPYQANGGIPYGANQVESVFNETLAIAQEYNVNILETYEVDIINVLSIAPTSFTISATASTGTGQWSGQQVWTVTAPWGDVTRPTFMEAMQQLVWKAGSQYGGRMQQFFATEATNVTEVGTP